MPSPSLHTSTAGQESKPIAFNTPSDSNSTLHNERVILGNDTRSPLYAFNWPSPPTDEPPAHLVEAFQKQREQKERQLCIQRWLDGPGSRVEPNRDAQRSAPSGWSSLRRQMSGIFRRPKVVSSTPAIDVENENEPPILPRAGRSQQVRPKTSRSRRPSLHQSELRYKREENIPAVPPLPSFYTDLRFDWSDDDRSSTWSGRIRL